MYIMSLETEIYVYIMSLETEIGCLPHCFYHENCKTNEEPLSGS